MGTQGEVRLVSLNMGGMKTDITKACNRILKLLEKADIAGLQETGHNPIVRAAVDQHGREYGYKVLWGSDVGGGKGRGVALVLSTRAGASGERIVYADAHASESMNGRALVVELTLGVPPSRRTYTVVVSYAPASGGDATTR